MDDAKRKEKEKWNVTVLVVLVFLSFLFQVSIVYGFLGYAIYLFISYFFFYKPIRMWDVVFYLGMVIALFIAVKLTT